MVLCMTDHSAWGDMAKRKDREATDKDEKETAKDWTRNNTKHQDRKSDEVRTSCEGHTTTLHSPSGVQRAGNISIQTTMRRS